MLHYPKVNKIFFSEGTNTMTVRILLSQAAAITLLAATVSAQEVSVKPESQKTDKQTAMQTAEQRQKIAAAASGFAPNSGKQAVIDRLQAMFSTNTRPIISTKKFKPLPPYMHVTHVPGNKLTPARSIIVYRCRFVSAEKLEDSIETAMGDAGTIDISPTQNTLVLNVLADRTEAMKETLQALDKPLPQVLVETQIVELIVKNGETRDTSLKFTHTNHKTGSTSSVGYSLGSGSNTTNESGFNIFPLDSISGNGDTNRLGLMINWINNSDDARILAAPNVIADLGTEATMETGEDLPYTENSVTSSAVTQSIKFKRTGVQLTIKPTIINGDTVQLEIKPQVTIAVRYESFAVPNSSGDNSAPVSNRIPVVSVRNIDTRLTAGDGEIIMLGGLYSSEASESKNAIPFLSDIPVIGDFFTSKNFSITDKQLLFFMKIHIIDNPYMVLLDPEKTAITLNNAASVMRGSKKLFNNPNIPEIDPGVRDVVEKKILKRKETLDKLALERKAQEDKKKAEEAKKKATEKTAKPAGK